MGVGSHCALTALFGTTNARAQALCWRHARRALGYLRGDQDKTGIFTGATR